MAEKIKLVPRGEAQGYRESDAAFRRQWLKREVGAEFEHVGQCTIPYEAMRGNIECPVGSVQMPVAVAGPLLMQGEYAQGQFYVPLATTEGALLSSYERGMVVISRSGGAHARVLKDENQVTPAFFFETLDEASRLSEFVAAHQEQIVAVAESTTRHGKCLDVTVKVSGKTAYVTFAYATGDAHGMNMIVNATECACRWIVAQGGAVRYHIFSGLSMEKRPAAGLLAGGKGKTVTVDVVIPKTVLSLYFRATAAQYVELWQQTVTGNLLAGALGYSGQFANGLAAIFIACGQDVANLANSAVGVTRYEALEEGALYASVTLPSIICATVGGGTGLPTSKECLSLMGCYGAGQAKKFAEIIGATLLAGELSIAGAIISGEFVNAHENYGRNRP